MSDCLNCGAPMRVDTGRGVFVCDHCGSQSEASGLIAHLQLLEPTSSRCPGCGTSLSMARLDGHGLRCCPQCFGTLVAMNRFVAVIETLRVHVRPSYEGAPDRPTLRRQPIACPMCAQPMFNHLYDGPGNVAIDTCERCQVNWLDAGELRHIASAPDRRGAR